MSKTTATTTDDVRTSVNWNGVTYVGYASNADGTKFATVTAATETEAVDGAVSALSGKDATEEAPETGPVRPMSAEAATAATADGGKASGTPVSGTSGASTS